MKLFEMNFSLNIKHYLSLGLIFCFQRILFETSDIVSKKVQSMHSVPCNKYAGFKIGEFYSKQAMESLELKWLKVQNYFNLGFKFHFEELYLKQAIIIFAKK